MPYFTLPALMTQWLLRNPLTISRKKSVIRYRREPAVDTKADEKREFAPQCRMVADWPVPNYRFDI
jgi:hypothetical protein